MGKIQFDTQQSLKGGIQITHVFHFYKQIKTGWKAHLTGSFYIFRHGKFSLDLGGNILFLCDKFLIENYWDERAKGKAIGLRADCSPYLKRGAKPCHGRHCSPCPHPSINIKAFTSAASIKIIADMSTDMSRTIHKKLSIPLNPNHEFMSNCLNFSLEINQWKW